MKTKVNLIDWEYLNFIFDNNDKEIQLFFNDYLVLMEQNLKTLKSAILDKNQKKVKEIFHFLKGSSGCVKKMYENCIEGENAVINSNWDNVSFTYQKIEELLGLLKKEMHNYYEK